MNRRTLAEEQLLQSLAESFYYTGGEDIADFVASACAGNAELAEVYAKSPNIRGGEDTAPLLGNGAKYETREYEAMCNKIATPQN
ncbi:hypothetical protein KY346_01280 [Candidatus Woesearchaeota archaeon]|nr:hypothetical protein [Candidatus Woesearchaeota archaeon]